MQVEEVVTLVGQNAPQTLAENAVGQEPEISAAAPRQGAVRKGQIAQRKFAKMIGNRAAANVLPIPRQVEMTVARVNFKGIVAGIVAIPALLQQAEGSVVDGKARGAEADHLGTGDIFKEMFAARQIPPKFFRPHVVAHLMTVAMGGHLVSLVGDIPHQSGQFVGNPAQDEKGRRAPIQQVEEAVHVPFDPQLTLMPGVFRDPGFEVFNLKPVFDIDGEKEGGGCCQNPT